MVIYEKRGFNNGFDGGKIRGEMQEGIIRAKGMSTITEYTKEDIPVHALSPVYPRKLKRKQRYIGRKTEKRHIPRKFLLALCTLIFCVFTIDNRLYGGRLLSIVKDYARNTVNNWSFLSFSGKAEVDDKPSETYYEEQQASENVSNENMFATQDVIEEVDLQPIQADDKADETASDLAVEVTGGVQGEAYSDGELFYPITTLDLSATDITELTNGTVYNPDMEKIKNIYPKALEGVAVTGEPLVLIVHTHACETYTEHRDMYPSSESTRTENIEKNMIRVGEEIAETLEDYGISTVHCTTLCDKESFIDAYNVSHDEVQRYLKEYPSIKIIIDVHRDAIIRQNGESIRPAVSIAGQDYAQLMFVAGTGQTAHSHPNWEENLSLALLIQSKTEERYPGLFRPVNLRSVPFNQWLSPGYLLLEVGSNSNTLDEAVLSAQAFAVTLSQVIKESAAQG